MVLNKRESSWQAKDAWKKISLGPKKRAWTPTWRDLHEVAEDFERKLVVLIPHDFYQGTIYVLQAWWKHSSFPVDNSSLKWT